MLAECQASSRQDAEEAPTPNSENIYCMLLHSVYFYWESRQALLLSIGGAN